MDSLTFADVAVTSLGFAAFASVPLLILLAEYPKPRGIRTGVNPHNAWKRDVQWGRG